MKGARSRKQSVTSAFWIGSLPTAVRLPSSGAPTARSSSPTRSRATCLILTSRLGLSLRMLLGKTAKASVSMVHFGTNSSAETSSVIYPKQGSSVNSTDSNIIPNVHTAHSITRHRRNLQPRKWRIPLSPRHRSNIHPGTDSGGGSAGLSY